MPERLQFARAMCADAAAALFASVVVGLVIASLAAAGIITMNLAYILLVLAWIVAIGGSFLITRPIQHKHRAIFAVFLAILLLTVGWLETRYYEKPLTAKAIAHEVTTLIDGAETSVSRLRDAAAALPSVPLASQVIPDTPPAPLLDVTPENLMDLYRDRTSVQADKLAQVYIGKLIDISGPLGNVSGPTNGPKDFKNDKMFVTLNNNDRRWHSGLIFMYFNVKWKERLESMTIKKKISARCEVVRISSIDLTLDNCDFRD